MAQSEKQKKKRKAKKKVATIAKTKLRKIINDYINKQLENIWQNEKIKASKDLEAVIEGGPEVKAQTTEEELQKQSLEK
jgi:hypothetical protein